MLWKSKKDAYSSMAHVKEEPYRISHRVLSRTKGQGHPPPALNQDTVKL